LQKRILAIVAPPLLYKVVLPFSVFHIRDKPIRKRHTEDNAYVERSHRTDDEEFYALKGMEMKTLRRILELLSEWILRYNIKRRHQGLNDLTPLEYLKSIKPEIHPAITLLPPQSISLSGPSKTAKPKPLFAGSIARIRFSV